MALKIEDIEKTLRDNLIAPNIIIKIVNDLEAAEEANKPERDDTPKAKNRFVVVSNDKDSAWVVQVKEDFDDATIESKLKAATKTFNATKKGRKHPISSWTELFAALPRKLTKDVSVDIHIKSKDLVRVITPTSQP